MNIPGLFYALCQTFLHSMWQGLLAAILAGMILLCTKRSSPQLRYYLLLFVFAAFMVAAGVTFYMVLPPVETAPLHAAVSIHAVITTGVVNPVQPGVGKLVLNYLLANSQLIVTVWFVVFLIRMANILSGLVFVQYMRRRSVCAHAGWQDKVNVMAAALGLKKPVRLLESAMAKVPMTAGFFKPVIYVPAGMVLGLPEDEVEAILRHELGHIRRGDYIVNLLQCLAEAIFFFNPALLWISSLLRAEREHCCDEIAVNGTNDKRNYIRALVAFQEYSAGTRAALHLTEKGGQLAARVKRMITRENKKLDAGEKAVLLISSIALLIFLASLSPAPRIISVKVTGLPAASIKVTTAQAKGDPSIAEALHSPAGTPLKPGVVKVKLRTPFFEYATASSLKNVQGAMIYVSASDTVPAFKSISTNVNDDGTTQVEEVTATDALGNRYHFRKVNGRITEFSKNNEVIDEADYHKYHEVLQGIEQPRERDAHKAAEQQHELIQQQWISDSLHSRMLIQEKKLRQQDSLLITQRFVEHQRMTALSTQRKKQALQRDSLARQREMNLQQRDKMIWRQNKESMRQDSVAQVLLVRQQVRLNEQIHLENKARIRQDSVAQVLLVRQQVKLNEQIRLENQARIKQDSLYRLDQRQQLNIQREQLRKIRSN